MVVKMGEVVLLLLMEPMKHNQTFEQLIWPTLNALQCLGGKGALSEIVDMLIQDGCIPPSELDASAEEKAEGSVLSRHLYLALTYLKKGGAIIAVDDNVWSLTRCGQKLHAEDIPGLVCDVRLSGQLFIKSLCDDETESFTRTAPTEFRSAERD